MKYEPYAGPITGKRATKSVLSAGKCWFNQKQRCENKNNPSYKHYGGKGIRVIYSMREFISWYLKNLSMFEGTDATVGRIDHDKNYSFNNIEMVSFSSNSSERNFRHCPNRKPVFVFSKKGERIVDFSSLPECAKFFGVHNDHMMTLIHSAQSLTRKKIGKSFLFSYRKTFPWTTDLTV